jgi:glycosyltransferase involved in cell wall biosynthesis
MSRRLLVIAYHFPPIQGSSGIHRTLAFAKFLREFGWEVTVLTVHTRAFQNYRAENLRMIPDHVDVVRANAWDTARHFSIGGWYPRMLALPDRWRSWIPAGVLAGRRIVRKLQPTALFSTFPIASAHEIALRLHESTGLPWIADFRDPMAQDGYPPDPAVWESYAKIERRVFERADRITVTTDGTAQYYAARYPAIAGAKIRVIENGFDPDAFASASPSVASERKPNGRLLLLHSGIVYPTDRDPEPFLKALARLHREGHVGSDNLEVRFRASGYQDRYQQMIDRMALQGFVNLAPSLPYDQATEEMQRADALLVFQARTCNRQIPAKLYEYFYAGRPILAMTDPAGDTGRLLTRMNVSGIAPLEETDSIYAMLREALERVRSGEYAVPDAADVAKLSRRARTQELAQLLDEMV